MKERHGHHYSTGWWGIPGGPSCRSTKVHIEEGGKPACGSRLGPKMVYQWCAWGMKWDYLECEHCKDIYRKKIHNINKSLKKSLWWRSWK